MEDQKRTVWTRYRGSIRMLGVAFMFYVIAGLYYPRFYYPDLETNSLPVLVSSTLKAAAAVGEVLAIMAPWLAVGIVIYAFQLFLRERKK